MILALFNLPPHRVRNHLVHGAFAGSEATEVAMLGAQKATDAEVKAFAQKMVTDHALWRDSTGRNSETSFTRDPIRFRRVSEPEE